MSNPHLDARRINGARSVLFGPYASTNPKFLKWGGSVTDLFSILRPHNIVPMLSVARDNLDLVAFLLSMIFMTPGKKNRTLKEFAPRADLRDFRMIEAGQRAQIIKPSKEQGGTLEFGTEIISSADGTIAGVLGASPGASTAVPIMFDLFERCFPRQVRGLEGADQDRHPLLRHRPGPEPGGGVPVDGAHLEDSQAQ